MPWNSIWQPGVYSEKNHDKIAEKYNMHPKEYKPAPKEECIGDYPDMPMIGPAAKDPYYPYDIPTYRKNYKEMVSIHVYKEFLKSCVSLFHTFLSILLFRCIIILR